MAQAMMKTKEREMKDEKEAERKVRGVYCTLVSDL
jgi:hypothetical protein